MVDAVQVGDEARKFVQGVVDAFGLEGTASVRQDGDDLEVAVDGNDLGLLVGPRGLDGLRSSMSHTASAARRPSAGSPSRWPPRWWPTAARSGSSR